MPPDVNLTGNIEAAARSPVATVKEAVPGMGGGRDAGDSGSQLWADR